MKRRLFFLAIILAILGVMGTTGLAFAQDYYFQLTQKIINVYWNEDGSLTLDYVLGFSNNSNSPAIEYVDVGTPNNNYDLSNVRADVDGLQVTDLSTSGYQGDGSGFAVGLGSRSIQPGRLGNVHVVVANIQKVLYTDSQDKTYASADFNPFWFGSQYVFGQTKMTVIFHLPPGIKPEEPRWHAAPSGFNETPDAGIDDQGRVTYTWTNPSASASADYQFGASFPKVYVPASSIQVENPFRWISSLNFDWLIPLVCVGGFLIFGLLVGSADNRRKQQYLPPAIRIEGHGIKRGLTAIEAAVLLEQPLEKVMTMLLFAVIKKGAAEVTSRDPLVVVRKSPKPEDLRTYEVDFLDAITLQDRTERERALRSTMVSLINATTTSMKGFSRQESIDYYRSIMEKAWQQVEAANTPEVKSQKFDEVMEWTMLDRDYDNRTRRVFRDVPIFIPRWWGGFDPSYRGASMSFPTSTPGSAPSVGGGLPHLPGSDFAASVVNQVQGFSSNVVRNIGDFTSSVTNTTNPAPVSTSSYSGRSSGGGGRSCACACACAGCACACAGGGR